MERILYSNFERYSESIENVDLHARLLHLNEPYWLMRRLQAATLPIQHAVEGSGFLTEGAVNSAGWGLLMQSAGEPILVNGMPLIPNAVAVLPPKAEFRFVGRGPTSWTSIFIPQVCDVGLHLKAAKQKSINVVALNQKLPQRLIGSIQSHMSRIEQCGQLTTIESTQFGRLVETTVLDILGLALGCESYESKTDRNRKELLIRSVNAINDSKNGLLSVRDLAGLADVTERTLLSVFREHFGMTPQDYLLAERLYRARRVLQKNAAKNATTVASVAARFGFFDFGRFARRYQRLFGELPSETLRSS